MASSERLKNHSGKKREKVALVYVEYLDHVEFRNFDLSKLQPCTRKVVGWLASENSVAMHIFAEMPKDPMVHERTVGSGFLILKSNVLKISELYFGKPFKRFQTGVSGQKLPYKMEN